MGDIYVLDSSAMETLNVLEASDEDLIERLVDLRDSNSLVYSEAVKEERRDLAKREPMTVWATSGWRSIQPLAALNFSSVQAVLKIFLTEGNQKSIMDMDEPDNVEQGPLTTVSLAHQLSDAHAVVVVSDEEFTSENRCTVKEACALLQVKHLSVADFLDAVKSN